MSTTTPPGRAAVERLVGSAPDGDCFDVFEPATGEHLARVTESSTADIETAIVAASDALPSWASMPCWQRFEVLRRCVNGLREVAGELAELICAETGKPLAEARGEAANTIRFFEWFSHETLRLHGEYWPGITGDRDAAVLREPVGVVAAITPWNFPAFLVACKVGAAIAAGCTVVHKPAEQTPLTALALAGVFERSGLPAGVWNVVTASRPEQVGDVLLDAPEIACVSFTGSRMVGEGIMRAAAGTIKRVLLELGGNSPAVVLADADLDLTAAQLVRARFLNAGQACMAANRVYAVEPVFDILVEKLREHTETLRVGNPREAGTNLGPLIDLAAVTRLEDQLAAAVDQGGKLVTGGRRSSENAVSAFLEPALIAAPGDAPPAVFREEIFGPALAVVGCRNEEDAIRLANATEYGLAGYVFTRDRQRALAVARRLVVGSVAVNRALISEPQLPFGGAKASGLGRERGRAGIEEFLELKTVHLG